jgi:hypothetical protein
LTGVTMTTGTAANYNAIFSDNGINTSWGAPGPFTITAVTTTSFSFAAGTGQNNGDIGGAPGITDFNYGTSASLQELNNTSSPANVQPCTYKREMPVTSLVAFPTTASILQDYGNGILKIRMHPVPSTVVWQVNIVYQKTFARKTGLTNTWGPIPDFAGSLYFQALLYRMYRYLRLPQADSEYQKLKEEITKYAEREDMEQGDARLQPECLSHYSYWGDYW